jgi:methionyl-tRNA formyltransferase
MSTPSSESWRIILFTDVPQIAAFYKGFLASAGHHLIATVTSSRRDDSYLDVIGGMQPEVDVLVSNHPRRWAGQLASLRPDLFIANVFSLRLPADALALPRLGAVNVHPALLPRYRGTMTPHWLLRHGEPESGVTLHRMAPDFDTGPILAQERFPITDDDDVDSLRGKTRRALDALWTHALPKIAAGDPGIPQDAAAASYYGAIPDEAAWKTIDWTQPSRTVHNVVRSSTFTQALPPGALADLDGVPHRITKTQLLPDSKGDGLPGSVVARDGAMLLVQCGDGLLGVVGYEAI